MKKGVCLGIVGNLIFLLLLMSMVPPVFAAPAQGSLAKFARTTARERLEARSRYQAVQNRPFFQSPRGELQQNNQHFLGNSASGNHTTTWGNNQSNTGNQGYNGWYNQDNSENTANQIINRHSVAHFSQNNQSFYGNSYVGNTNFYGGSNQGNGGNQGYNEGVNQDNGTNTGNQIIN